MASNPQKFCRTSMTRSLNTAQAAEMLGVDEIHRGTFESIGQSRRVHGTFGLCPS
jgi:hypothetical protein